MANQLPTAHGPYRYDVDGLRAIAVLAVVLYHYKFDFLSGGFIGVDIFFVISGFVIAKSIFAELGEGSFTISNFYFKRVRRIIPALFVVYLLTSIFAAIILLPNDLISYSKSLIASATFVSNIFFWKSSAYFNPIAETQPLLHTWSLSVEEQYYLFAPLLFALLHYLKLGKRVTIAVLVALFSCSLALSIAAVYTAPTAGFFLLPTRLWELLLGAVVAVQLSRDKVRLGAFANSALSVVGLALIIFGLFTIQSGDPFPGWNALYPCVGTALIILGGTTDRPPLVNRLLGTRIPVGIGKISYSLYLIHWPIIAFINYYVDGRLSSYAYSALILIAIIASYLSWRYIEQPFRSLSYDQVKAAFARTGLGIASFSVLATVIIASNGFPQRYPDFIERKIPGVEDWGGDACFHQNPTTLEAWDPVLCKRTTGSSGSVLLWGDSFAAHYIPGLLANAPELDKNIFQYTFAGCPPILGYYSLARPACSQFNREALSLLGKYDISTVILSSRWSEVPKSALEQLSETIAEIKSHGVNVIVVGPSPQFSANVLRLDYLSGASKSGGQVFGSAAGSDEVLEDLAHQSKEANFINPLASLCVSNRCAYRIESDYLYADYGHLSKYGADFAVRAYLMPAMKQEGSQGIISNNGLLQASRPPS